MPSTKGLGEATLNWVKKRLGEEAAIGEAATYCGFLVKQLCEKGVHVVIQLVRRCTPSTSMPIHSVCWEESAP